MIGRALLLVVVVLAAGCTKPRGTPQPSHDAAKHEGGGAWAIESVEPAVAASAGASQDGDAGATRDSDATDAEPGDASASASAGAGDPAGADAGAEAGQGGEPPRVPTTPGRTAIVPLDHPQHGRLEGDGLPNACKRDGECAMGGCAREVCSAERGVTTTCEAMPVQLPTDAACGCVGGECIWYSRGGVTLPLPKRDGPEPNRGEAPRKPAVACGKTTCKPGQQCIEYYGIAGSSGPKFESCEWPCAKGQRCPKGTTCTTIADGPGRVCR